MGLIADIGVARTKKGRLKVITATLWNKKRDKGFSGVLDDMLGKIYENESEIDDVVNVILGNWDVFEDVEVIFHEWWDTKQGGESLNYPYG